MAQLAGSALDTQRHKRRCKTLTGDAQIDAIAVHPPIGGLITDASLLAVATSNLEGSQWSGGIELLDASTLQQISRFRTATGITSLAWNISLSDDTTSSDILVCGCDNGDVLLLKLEIESSEPVLTPLDPNGELGTWGHDDIVTSVSASKIDANTVISGSWDLIVKVWDLSSESSNVSSFEGHSDLIWDVAMSPIVGTTLASAAQDATIHMWDTRQPMSPSLVLDTQVSALSLSWHPTQECILSTGLEDGVISTFDTRLPKKPLSTLVTHKAAIHTLAYAPFDSPLLLSGGDDATVHLTTNTLQNPQTCALKLETEHQDYVRAVDWVETTDGDTHGVSGSWDHILRMWSMEDSPS